MKKTISLLFILASIACYAQDYIRINNDTTATLSVAKIDISDWIPMAELTPLTVDMFYAISPNTHNGHVIQLPSTAEYEVMFYDENNSARDAVRTAYGYVITSSGGVQVTACGPSGTACMSGTYYAVPATNRFVISFRQPGATIRLRGATNDTIVIWY